MEYHTSISDWESHIESEREWSLASKKNSKMAAQHKLINQNCDFTPGTNANQYYYSIRLIYIFPRPLIHHPRKLNATWRVIWKSILATTSRVHTPNKRNTSFLHLVNTNFHESSLKIWQKSSKSSASTTNNNGVTFSTTKIHIRMRWEQQPNST